MGNNFIFSVDRTERQERRDTEVEKIDGKTEEKKKDNRRTEYRREEQRREQKEKRRKERRAEKITK